MYSWEIKKLMELKQYIIEVEDYIHILNTSPQINFVSHDTFSGLFHISTDDNYSVDFNVYVKENR